MTIPIDFVAGSHGNFLETILNTYFHVTAAEDTFTQSGTSHRKSDAYQANKLFHARHWSELESFEFMKQFEKIIAIRFSQDDLLLLSSVSLLRAGDMAIDNNELHINTRVKLSNRFYGNTLELIDKSYPFLDPKDLSIPRNVLREFFKFGFRDPNINGYWLKQSLMKYPSSSQVFYIDFDAFYDFNKLVYQLQQLEKFLNRPFDFCQSFKDQHTRFLNYIPYIDHKQQCDHIIECVQTQRDIEIPKLSLLQESYINGILERIYSKEMPFHSISYFISTADMLHYIRHQAPSL